MCIVGVCWSFVKCQMCEVYSPSNGEASEVCSFFSCLDESNISARVSYEAIHIIYASYVREPLGSNTQPSCNSPSGAYGV